MKLFQLINECEIFVNSSKEIKYLNCFISLFFRMTSLHLTIVNFLLTYLVRFLSCIKNISTLMCIPQMHCFVLFCLPSLVSGETQEKLCNCHNLQHNTNKTQRGDIMYRYLNSYSHILPQGFKSYHQPLFLYSNRNSVPFWYVQQNELIFPVTCRNKVLFTNHCRWQNFRPSLLCLVDRAYTQLLTRCKRLRQKFCHLQRSVDSTLIYLLISLRNDFIPP